MWSDKKNAAEHYADLQAIRKHVEAEPRQMDSGTYLYDDCKKFRLKLIDEVIAISKTEMNAVEKEQEHFK